MDQLATSGYFKGSNSGPQDSHRSVAGTKGAIDLDSVTVVDVWLRPGIGGSRVDPSAPNDAHPVTSTQWHAHHRYPHIERACCLVYGLGSGSPALATISATTCDLASA
jgi:hypothetical protein